MRTAPPVSVRCSGGLVWRALRAGVPALAAAALAAWGIGHGGGSAAWALPVLVLAAGAAWPLARTEPVALAWDGQRWTADGMPGALAVMLDIGGGLLLRLQPDAWRRPPRWVAVTAREAGSAMHALRAAAYARAPGAVPAGGPGPDGLHLPR